MMDELKVQLKTFLPSAVSTEPKWYKGFIDIGFKSDEDADKAALAIIQIQGNTLDITRTRYKDDENLYISLANLPNNMDRNELIARLKVGLCNYGKVLKFEMEEDELLPHLAMTRAIAIIAPNKDVSEDLTLIPRQTFIYDNNKVPSRFFKVTPEDAPKICSHCECIGHIAIACPKTVAGLNLLMSSEDEEMDTGDQISSTAMPYPWGEYAEYVLVDPVSKEQKKEAKKALKQKNKKENLDKKNKEAEELARLAAHSSLLETEERRRVSEEEYNRAMEVVARNREERRLEEEAIEIERRKQDAILADLREQEIQSARNQQFIPENSNFQNLQNTSDPQNLINADEINRVLAQLSSDVQTENNSSNMATNMEESSNANSIDYTSQNYFSNLTNTNFGNSSQLENNPLEPEFVAGRTRSKTKSNTTSNGGDMQA